MRRPRLVVALVATAAGVWLFDTLRAAGQWREIAPHFAGTCRAVDGMPGPEELTIHPPTGSPTSRERIAGPSPPDGPGAARSSRSTSPRRPFR